MLLNIRSEWRAPILKLVGFIEVHRLMHLVDLLPQRLDLIHIVLFQVADFLVQTFNFHLLHIFLVTL